MSLSALAVFFLIIWQVKVKAHVHIVTSDGEYYIVTSTTGWEYSSRRKCPAAGGTRAIIKTNDEFEKISYALNASNYMNWRIWIKLTVYNYHNQRYEWQNEPINSDQWISADEPNQNCYTKCITMSRTTDRSSSSYSDRHLLMDTCCTVRQHSLCNDINECAQNNGGCSSTQTCINEIGSRTCYNKPVMQVDNPRPFIGGSVVMRCPYAGGIETLWEKDTNPIDTSSAPNPSELRLTDFQVEMSGQYACVVKLSDTVSITSNIVQVRESLPTPVLRVTETDIIPGFAATLTCDTVSILGREGVWRKDGTTEMARNSLIWIVNDFEGDDEGEYTCQLKVGGIVSGLSNVVVLRANLPAPVITASNAEVKEGGSVQLSCRSDVVSPSEKSYRWWHQLTALQENSANMNLNNFEESMDGDYRCNVVINGVTSGKSEILKLTFKEDDTPVLYSPITSIPAGTTIKLTCKHQLPNNSAVRWVKDGNVFSKGKNVILTLKDFGEGDEGQYSCKVSEDRQVWERSNNMSLTVIPRNSLCYCPCINVPVNHSLPNTTTIKEVASNIQQTLKVKVKTLSAAVAKRTSASDERASSSYVGWLAVALICVVFSLILVSDMNYIIPFISDRLAWFKSKM